MDFARNLRGFCVGFARNLILFLFEREREGYKRFAACTVHQKCGKHHILANSVMAPYFFIYDNRNKAEPRDVTKQVV